MKILKDQSAQTTTSIYITKQSFTFFYSVSVHKRSTTQKSAQISQKQVKIA